MPQPNSPRRGTLEHKRKRAKKELPTVSNWPDIDKATLLGFPVYKCGMITAYVEKEFKTRYQEVFGRETTMGATVLEAPPIRVLAIRSYKETPYGKKTFTDVWTPSFSDFERKFLERTINLPKNYNEEKQEKKLENLSNKIEELDEIHIVARTMPELTKIGRKTPKLLEIAIGGDVQDSFAFSIEHLGKRIDIGTIFQDNDFVDTIGVTKGQGFQGVVKRFGVRLLPPKTKKGQRKVAAMGPFTPGRTSWRVPQAGQTGFHKRTEYNKQILKILDKEESKNFNPGGGWKHYGLLQQNTIVLKGSVQGPQKRTLLLRKAIRPKEKTTLKVDSFWYSDEKLKEF